MMKLISVLFVIIMLVHHIKAQDSSNIKPNAVYAEAFGIGMRYSINYERYFDFKKTDFGLSLSGGIAPNFSDPKYLWFPLRLDANYLIGKSRIGVAINYMWGFYWEHGFLHPEDVVRSTDYFVFPVVNYQYFILTNMKLEIELNFISANWEDDQNIYFYLVELPFNNLELYNRNFVIWPGFSVGYTF